MPFNLKPSLGRCFKFPLFLLFVPQLTGECPMKKYAFLLLFLVLFLASPVFAGGSGGSLPWEQPLSRIMDSVSGPVARALGVIAVVITGLGIAFSEGGGAMRKILFVCFGLTVTFAAVSFFLNFFGFSGGAGF
jgi:type IV secretory pathway VirB2 component (pilin)